VRFVLSKINKKELSEIDICDLYITPAIKDAGWDQTSQIRREVTLTPGPFGSMVHKRDSVKNGIPLINPSHMVNCTIVAENSVAVSLEKAEELSSYKLTDGEIVMARRGELGRCAMVTEEENGWLSGTGSFRLKFHSDLCLSYIMLLFRTDSVKKYLGGKSVGATMSNLNHSILKKMPVLLPPSSEQHRIIDKVDKLMALCDTLKARLSEYQTTQIHLANAMVKQAVSQKAEQG